MVPSYYSSSILCRYDIFEEKTAIFFYFISTAIYEFVRLVHYIMSPKQLVKSNLIHSIERKLRRRERKRLKYRIGRQSGCFLQEEWAVPRLKKHCLG